MKSLRLLALVVIFLSVSTLSYAWWGLTGHRVIGEIADRHLTKKAKKAIREILGDESIAISANWADFIKSDSNYRYLEPWHYLNVKAGVSLEDFRKKLDTDTNVNAYNRLQFLTNELKKKDLSHDQKVFYLRLLVHIAGDIHQPLHVGRPEDLGANRIKVQWFNEATNLHSVWDTRLVEQQNLSYTEYVAAINHSTKDQRKQWQAQPMWEWFYESYQHANQIYAGITQPDQKLGYNYNFDYVNMMNSQLLKGGIRLAGLLNSIFG